MSHNIYHILATHTITLNNAQKKALKKHNIHMENKDFIHITHTIDREEKKALSELFTKKNTAVICTSKNALRSISKHYEKNIIANTQWIIYCTGNHTTVLCKKIFPKSQVHYSGNTSKAFTENFPLIKNRNTFFHILSGDLSLPVISSFLTKQGIAFQKYTLYTTVFTPYVLKKNYEAIIFRSPSAVNSFFSANTCNTHQGTYFCIGTTTRDALLQFAPHNTILLPEIPDTKALIKTICIYFKSLSLCPTTPYKTICS